MQGYLNGNKTSMLRTSGLIDVTVNDDASGVMSGEQQFCSSRGDD
jgi:hypothetical protein